MKKTLDIKKLILLNMPYILLGLFATNFGEAWRMAQGADASEKFLSLVAVLPGALQSFWPSLHPLDLLVGLCCGGSLRLAVYLKSKNAKKYRHGLEYGSARWGTREDKLLYLHTDNSKAEVLRAAMLQKGFNLILVNSLREAKHRLLEDKEIELILCDLSLPDGTALELFHDIRRISEKFKVNNPPIKLLPFFILTASTDLATEYQYRHEGVSDYITAPVNIPELIRRILFFVE